MKLELTVSKVKNPPETKAIGGQQFYWDSVVKGFGMVVSPNSKSFVVQGTLNGSTKRVTLGRVGGVWKIPVAENLGPVCTLAAARKAAQTVLYGFVTGQPPVAPKPAKGEPWKTLTLAQAAERHVQSMKKKDCAERSIDEIGYLFEKYLNDWMDRPLASITHDECEQRHTAISENGPVTANNVFRKLRAVWNTARRPFPELRTFPAITFNKQSRRREPIPWGDLPSWADKIDAVGNAIRCDLWWFVLLTGLRDEDARTVRWEHIDFEAGTIHRPKPKGGVDRAFTVPLSKSALDILRRRRDDNELDFGRRDNGWVWPSWGRGKITHLPQLREQEYWKDADGKQRKRTTMPSPHRLRDTFAIAAKEAGVGMLEIKVLMNHTLPDSGDVTTDYMRPSIEHLREQVEKIASFLLAKAGRMACAVGSE